MVRKQEVKATKYIRVFPRDYEIIEKLKVHKRETFADVIERVLAFYLAYNKIELKDELKKF